MNPEARLFRKFYVVLPFAAVVLAWLATGCGTGSQAAASRGRTLFETCVPCHGTDGAGNRAVGAPPIAGLPLWYVRDQLTKFKGDIRGAHPDDAEGHRMRPMARTLRTPGDVEAVAGHVAGLPAVRPERTLPGDAAAGQARYTVCLACHGPDARGNEGLHAPPLAGQADWYLEAQLVKFKSGMRGAHPQDTFGAQMRAMATTLPDAQAVRDVVAYIKSLDK